MMRNWEGDGHTFVGRWLFLRLGIRNKITSVGYGGGGGGYIKRRCCRELNTSEKKPTMLLGMLVSLVYGDITVSAKNRSILLTKQESPFLL